MIRSEFVEVFLQSQSDEAYLVRPILFTINHIVHIFKDDHKVAGDINCLNLHVFSIYKCY